MEIRAVEYGDADALASLLGELGYPEAADRVARRLEGILSDSASYVLVAEEAGALVGVVSVAAMPLLHEDGSWCRITALVVAAERRRVGVGRALVESAEQWALGRGCRYSEVTSGERPGREAAHQFYEAVGYEQVSRRFLKAL